MSYTFFMLVAILIVVFIIAFAAASVWYIWVNNGAKEALDIVYPAAATITGAILLSAYLGYKSIVLDNPPPKTFGVTIAILADRTNGTISASPRRARYLRLGEFGGLLLVDAAFQDTAFAGLDLQGGLRNASDDLFVNRVEDILEYALLHWFAMTQDVRVGYQSGYFTLLVNGGGGMGGPVAPDLVEVDTSLGVNEPNPLLRVQPIKLALPRGSHVIRSADRRYAIEVRTPHSSLKIRFPGLTAEPLRAAATSDGERIYAALGLPNPPPQGFAMYAFRIEFEATQKPSTRYAVAAKREARWIGNSSRALERDFSWERLRALYTSQ